MLRKNRYFAVPDARAFVESDQEYLPGAPSYTSYNYFGTGPVARIKSAHFEAALDLTRDLHGRTGAIDFGCADGVFLPSLARYFQRVYAVDVRPDMIDAAGRVRDELGLQEVTLVCNRDRDFDSLAQDLRGERYGVAFILETLEHVGEASRLYESKMDFLAGVLGLLDPGGRAVISVPTMTGLPYLLQRMALRGLRMHREEIGRRDLLNAVFRRNTDALEPTWVSYSHLGFNHRKLERYIRERFRIVHHRNLFFTHVYVVTAEPE